YIFLLFFLGITYSLSAQDNDEPWTEVSKTVEMEVYKRAPENSEWKEIKIIQYIKAPMQTIVDVIEDVDAYPSWIFKCSESHLVEQISKDEMVYYNVTDMPFPFWDRAIVIHSFSEYDAVNNIQYFRSKATTDYKEVSDDFVQITDFTSYWEISEQDDGVIRVLSKTTVDPAGSVPAWIVNMAVTKGPTKTAKRFREKITARKNKKGDNP
ncbi:MAG: START domain-containing protein, partial [Saprospiraceae bacterium]